MERKRSETAGILGALALLVLVSFYRQISLRFLPGDFCRPYIVYAVYLLLISGWVVSVRNRITQRSMRIFLLGEAFVMLFWLSIRFVQEAFLYRDIYLVRILGYFIIIPAVTVPLLGLYAAFGLGRGDDYRFSSWLYLLILPAAALSVMALTNENHHFLYRSIAGEPEPNLYFHPNYGIFIVYGWSLLLIVLRTVVIYSRSRQAGNRSFIRRLAPFAEPLLLLAFCAPYTIFSFRVHRELVEFSAGVSFIEAVSWELFIWLGLIPVNTQYQTVFDRSTVGMQIVADDGSLVAKSRTAPALSPDIFARIVRAENLTTEEGQELQAYRLQSGYLVWQREVSQLHYVIEKLQRSEAELRQESGLLSQELKMRSVEAAVSEQNRIYDRLSIEVGPQLRLMEQFLKKQETVADKKALFRRICLVGTYVKRRCSLRLMEQSEGSISGKDLAMSFREMTARLSGMGIGTSLTWETSGLPSADFAMLALDVFEFLLEYQRFELSAVDVSMHQDESFSIGIRPAGGSVAAAPQEELARMGGNDFTVVCYVAPEGYSVLIREEERAYVEA